MNLGAEHELPITCATVGCYDGDDIRNFIKIGDNENICLPSFNIHPLISTHLYNLLLKVYWKTGGNQEEFDNSGGIMMHPGKTYPIRLWHRNGILSLWILDNFQKSYELVGSDFIQNYVGELQTIYIAGNDPNYSTN